jgi:hypothetical protein
MNPDLWRTISYIFIFAGTSLVLISTWRFGKRIIFLGTALVLIGSMGTCYFGKRVEVIAPYKQPIRTATATVEVTIMSDKKINAKYLDRNSNITFIKGKEELLFMSSTQCRIWQTGEGKIIYRTLLNMDVADSAVGKPIYFLKEAEYAQIYFRQMPKESKVLDGKAICTFNNIVRIEITIPSQEIEKGLIFASDLENVFSEFVK